MHDLYFLVGWTFDKCELTIKYNNAKMTPIFEEFCHNGS